MKACLSLTMLSLIAFAHGAKLAVPTVSEHPALSTEERRSILKKAGKALEKLENTVQEDTGSFSMEELQNTLKDRQVFDLFQGKDISEEYFVGKLIEKIGDTLGSFGKVVDEGLKIGK